MRPDVRTNKYVSSHRRKPRGDGVWWFNIGGRPKMIVGQYSEARKRAVEIAIDEGARTVEVMP